MSQADISGAFLTVRDCYHFLNRHTLQKFEHLNAPTNENFKFKKLGYVSSTVDTDISRELPTRQPTPVINRTGNLKNETIAGSTVRNLTRS